MYGVQGGDGFRLPTSVWLHFCMRVSNTHTKMNKDNAEDVPCGPPLREINVNMYLVCHVRSYHLTSFPKAASLRRLCKFK